MSVEPNTPDDWRTVTVNGVKVDIGPDSTAAELLEKIRTRKLKNKHNRSSRAWKTASPETHGLVKESAIEVDKKGWAEPDSPDQYADADLSDVSEGECLRAHRAPTEWEPIYEG